MLSTMIGLGQNLKKYKDFGLLRPWNQKMWHNYC